MWERKLDITLHFQKQQKLKTAFSGIYEFLQEKYIL